MTFDDPDISSLIAEQLESGRYASADEVILAGLKLLQNRENGNPLDGTSEAPQGDTAHREAMRLLQQGDGPGPRDRTNDPEVSLAMVAEITKDVPDSEWDEFPPDFSQNIDHYLYGTPKRS